MTQPPKDDEPGDPISRLNDLHESVEEETTKARIEREKIDQALKDALEEQSNGSEDQKQRQPFWRKLWPR